MEPPGAARRGLPLLADEICLRALSHDVEKRYPSAAAFRADLLKLAAQSGGRRTTRQLGEYLSRLFVLERQREQKIIELALERASRGGEPSPAVLGEGASFSPAIALKQTPRRASSGDVDASEFEPTRWADDGGSLDTQALPAREERPRKNRHAIIAGFAIGAAVAAPLWFLNSVQSSASDRKIAQGAAIAAAPIESATPSQEVSALPLAPSMVVSPPPVDHAQDPSRATNARAKSVGKHSSAGGARPPVGESSDGLGDRK